MKDNPFLIIIIACAVVFGLTFFLVHALNNAPEEVTPEVVQVATECPEAEKEVIEVPAELPNTFTLRTTEYNGAQYMEFDCNQDRSMAVRVENKIRLFCSPVK